MTTQWTLKHTVCNYRKNRKWYTVVVTYINGESHEAAKFHHYGDIFQYLNYLNDIDSPSSTIESVEVI